MRGELAVKGGKMTGLRATLLSDQGAFYADAQPTKFRAGLFHIVTGSYDIPAAHVVADGWYTNKAPGGVAYRCSFRVTEASYLIERLVDNAAHELGVDATQFRLDNFIQPEQFPYESATGFVYDSGNYPEAMRIALEKLGYEELRREQEAGPGRGPPARDRASRRSRRSSAPATARSTTSPACGCSTRPSSACTRPARRSSSSASSRRVRATRRRSGRSSPQELGIPTEDIEVQEGDTDNTPYGLGTYASRSTPVAGAATTVIARKLRDKGREIAAHLLEASADDIEFEAGRFFVKGSPERAKTIQDVAFAAYTDLPDGMEAGLEGVTYYDPPNMTFPFGTYAVVVEVDRGTGQWRPIKVVAVDDCGVRINPMIVEGQIMGGLTEGYAIAAMQLIDFDEDGNCIGSNFTDYLIPTAWETPEFDLGELTTPSPHHPLGAKGVGESATVGSPAAYVNAVIDALWHAGVKNIDMPLTPDKVWDGDARGGDRGVTEPTPRLDRGAVLVEAGRLAAEGRPFVLATVASVRRPASARIGDRGIVTAGREARRVGRWRVLGAGGRARGAARARGGDDPAAAHLPAGKLCRRGGRRRGRELVRVGGDGRGADRATAPAAAPRGRGRQPGSRDASRPRRRDRLGRDDRPRGRRRGGGRRDDGSRRCRGARRGPCDPGGLHRARRERETGRRRARGPARARSRRGDARARPQPRRARPRPADPAGDRRRGAGRARRLAPRPRPARRAAGRRRSTPSAG